VTVLLSTFAGRRKDEDFDRELISDKRVIRVSLFITLFLFLDILCLRSVGGALWTHAVPLALPLRGSIVFDVLTCM